MLTEESLFCIIGFGLILDICPTTKRRTSNLLELKLISRQGQSSNEVLKLIPGTIIRIRYLVDATSSVAQFWEESVFLRGSK